MTSTSIAFVWSTTDLQCKIFTFLDFESLIKAECVNKSWKLHACLPASVEYLNFNQFFEPNGTTLARNLKDRNTSLFRYNMLKSSKRFQNIRTLEWDATRTISWYELSPFWHPNDDDLVLFPQFETWHKLENIILKFGLSSSLSVFNTVPSAREGMQALYLALKKRSDKIKNVSIHGTGIDDTDRMKLNDYIKSILFEPDYINLQSICLSNVYFKHQKENKTDHETKNKNINELEEEENEHGDRMFLCCNKYLQRIRFVNCNLDLSFWFDFASNKNKSFENVQFLSITNDSNHYLLLNKHLSLLKKFQIMENIGSKFIYLKSIEFTPFGRVFTILLQSIMKSQFENSHNNSNNNKGLNLKILKLTVHDMQSIDCHSNNYPMNKLFHVEITAHLECFALKPNRSETFLACLLNLLIASKLHSTKNQLSESQSNINGIDCHEHVQGGNENKNKKNNCFKYENSCESIRLTFRKKRKRKSCNFGVMKGLCDKLDAIRFTNLENFSLNLLNLTIKTSDLKILKLLKSLNRIYKQRFEKSDLYFDINIDVSIYGDLLNFSENEMITMFNIVEEWYQYGLISINIEICQSFKPKFKQIVKSCISRFNSIINQCFARKNNNFDNYKHGLKIEWSMTDNNVMTFKIQILDASIKF